MRFRRNNADTTALSTAAVSVQNTGITRGEGEGVRGQRGTTVTMHGEIGTSRTATVTDSVSGRVIGTIQVDEACKVTGITPAK